MRLGILKIIGKTTSFLASTAFGAGAGGFIIASVKMFGFDPTSPTAPLSGTVLLYTGAGVIGLNGFYRMWRVISNGSVSGLKMIFEKDNKLSHGDSLIQEETPTFFKKEGLRIVGIGLSFFAGATYGGLAYLGITELVPSENMAWNVASGVVTIGSVCVAAGSLFSGAWLTQLKSGALFTKHKHLKSRTYIAAEIFSSGLMLYGLGTIMELGSLGLAKSVSSALSPTYSKILGSCIAFIEFLGEAPFSIQQARLVVKKAGNKIAPPIKGNSGQKMTCSSYAESMSTFMYASGYLFGSIASIDLPTAGKTTSAIGASYLAVVSSLVDDDVEPESDQPLLPSTETLPSPSDEEVSSNTTSETPENESYASSALQ